MHEWLAKFFSYYKKHPILAWMLSIAVFILSYGLILIPIILIGVTALVYYSYELTNTLLYYQSPEFKDLKTKLAAKIIEYNEFDHFMDETRDYIWKEQKQLSTTNKRHSTLTVYKNSKLDIYKYIVKYFFNSSTVDESTMQHIEKILQKYNTINQTYEILTDEYKELMDYIYKHMPTGAYIFKSLTMKKLGSRKLPKFIRDYYIRYSFEYNSPTNRNYRSNSITLNESKLESFAKYLNELIKYKKSAKYQRQLMTPKLRESILHRDGYKCKSCGVSRELEAHLLLEIDHILPISKGGITIEDNLQSLCWKCNRSKGAKILA